MDIKEILVVCSIVVSVLGLGISTALSMRRLEGALEQVGNQLWLASFLAFTQRYSEALNELPQNLQDLLSSRDLDLVEVGGSDISDLKRFLRTYLNLCSEEYYVCHVRGYLDEETWGIWRDSLREHMRHSLVADLCREMIASYSIVPGFSEEVMSVIASEQVPPT